jgi:hypothetical protein
MVRHSHSTPSLHQREQGFGKNLGETFRRNPETWPISPRQYVDSISARPLSGTIRLDFAAHHSPSAACSAQAFVPDGAFGARHFIH